MTMHVCMLEHLDWSDQEFQDMVKSLTGSVSIHIMSCLYVNDLSVSMLIHIHICVIINLGDRISQEYDSNYQYIHVRITSAPTGDKCVV